MKQKYSLLLIICFVTITLQAQTKLTLRVTEQDVKTAIDNFATAFKKADVTILAKLLCENYIHVNGNSGNIIEKKHWLKWNRSRTLLIGNGELVINNYQIQDLQVQVYEKVAIVVGVVKSAGFNKGVPFQSQLRFTNVWVVENNKLCRASFHDSAIK